jgi:hypothetical protein
VWKFVIELDHDHDHWHSCYYRTFFSRADRHDLRPVGGWDLGN